MLDLDDLGFPLIAIANRLLIEQSDFGESREDLENNWQAWLRHMPFDAPVAGRLCDIYQQRLAQLDPQKDAGSVQRLSRKMRLTQGRAERYEVKMFDH